MNQHIDSTSDDDYKIRLLSRAYKQLKRYSTIDPMADEIQQYINQPQQVGGSHDAEHRFGPPRRQPHADFINSKHQLDYAITDLVEEFIAHHDLQSDQIQIVVTYAGCYTKVTL